MIADEIWILTAFSVVPQNFLILRCCFSHLKNLCKASHKFFYDKYIIMQSRYSRSDVKMLIACYFYANLA